MKDRALILRNMPYSDHARIIKCLTEQRGVITCFHRFSSKKKGAGYIQTGSFVKVVVQTHPGKMSTLTECDRDAVHGSTLLTPQHTPVWLFTLELLNKSLPDEFNIPRLWESIDRYYSLLILGAITTDPLTCVLMLSKVLGITDPMQIHLKSGCETHENLTSLGIVASSGDFPHDSETFARHLEEFKQHFNINRIEALDLL